MSATATYAFPPPAGRVLAHLLPELRRFQLRKPGQILAELKDLEGRAFVLELWATVFGGVPPSAGSAGQCTFDLEVAFVQRVDAELFPVDLYAMDGFLGCDEDPLYHGIPIDCLGVAWEADDFDSWNPGLQALLAFIADHLAESSNAADWLNVGTFLQAAADWREKHDVAVSWGLPSGDGGLAALRQALVLLPAPLDGLATALDVSLRNTGNPFLDDPGGGWGCEYDAFEGLYWTVHDVQLLAAQYAAARPRIQRLSAYYEWYEHTPDAQAQVVELLARLTAGGWTIQDGEIIDHDQEE